MKRIILVLSTIGFLAGIMSSCQGNKKCPAYEDEDSKSQANISVKKEIKQESQSFA